MIRTNDSKLRVINANRLCAPRVTPVFCNIKILSFEFSRRLFRVFTYRSLLSDRAFASVR